MRSFLINMPKIYYPDLIRQFYANLEKDEFGNITSIVNEKQIQLNPPILAMILDITVNSNVEVYSHGSLSFTGFTYVDQLNVLVAPNKLMELALPTTPLLNPLAHLLFKI